MRLSLLASSVNKMCQLSRREHLTTMTTKTIQFETKIFLRSLFGFSKKTIYSVIVGFVLCSGLCLVSLNSANAAEDTQLRVNEPTFGQSFSSPMPKISGTVVGIDEIQVFIDGKQNGSATVADGRFEYHPFLPLSSGEHFIFVCPKQNGICVENAGYGLDIFIVPNPSPTILYPQQDTNLGNDRAWIGGVAKNDSLVLVFVDGKEVARGFVKNHKSGVASFGIEINGVSLGIHNIYAVARDKQGKDSLPSGQIEINLSNPTPAPVLMKPVVNSDSGIERPFIVGLAKAGTEVSIIVDGKIAHSVTTNGDLFQTASFSWQPSVALSLGEHKIEAFTSDNGKLSNNSKPIFWQVGYVGQSEPGQRDNKVTREEDSREVVVVDGSDEGKTVSVSDESSSTPLTVKDDLSFSSEAGIKEIPIVPDEGDSSKQADEGMVVAEDDNVLGDSAQVAQGVQEGTNESNNGITQITPGSVQRSIENGKNIGSFSFNTSFVVGVVILLFLLLSIFVWYMQERRDNLSDKVVSIFREDEEDADFGKNLSQENPSDLLGNDSETKDFVGSNYDLDKKETEQNHESSDRYHDDFPPPPPPMF
jgi:hypothetical protein